MDKTIYSLFLECIEMECIKVKRKIRDFCGPTVKCSKTEPTCAVSIKSYGIPKCINFNNSLLVIVKQNERITLKVSQIKSINILNGFDGWHKINHKTELRLNWTPEMGGRILWIFTASRLMIIEY